MTPPEAIEDVAGALVLRGVALPGENGSHDVVLEGGHIAAIDLRRGQPERLALPAFADLHLHADRAYARGPQQSKSLADAIEQVQEIRASATEQEIFDRACRLFERALGHGSIRLRTHVDVDPLVEDRPLRAISAARAQFAGRLDVSIVAFATSLLDPAAHQADLRLSAAVSMGADMVGTAIPFHPDPQASIDALLDQAESLGVKADFHIDETVDPDVLWVGYLADRCHERGLVGVVSASHCCSLSSVESDLAARTIEKLAAARMSVIVLPATNLYLQDRGSVTPRRRGLTLVRELIDAGVGVRFGSDNVGDVFYPYGDADPLEAAFLAAIGAHLEDEDDLLAAICDGRSRLRVGDPADIVVIPARSLRDALARRPGGRTVIRGGRILSGPLPPRSLQED
jgi:cytosine/creatinine deaminase